MPIASLTRMLLFAPHDSYRGADHILTLRPNGQLSIANLNSEGRGETVFDPEGHSWSEAVLRQDAQGTQPSSTLIDPLVGAQATSVVGAGAISSSLNSATLTSFKSLSSPTPTTTVITSNSISSNSSSFTPTALASFNSAHMSEHPFSVLFYFAIILGAICIIACGLALARHIRSRASAQNTGDNDKPSTARDLLGDEESLQVRIPHDEPQFYLPASIARQDMSGRSTPSVQEAPQTLGRLWVANIAPGDLTSGDESSVIHRTQTYQSTMAGDLGTRSAVRGSNRTPPPLEGDKQTLPSSRFAQSRMMENTPATDHRERHPDRAEPQEAHMVHERPPREKWATVLKPNLIWTVFGTVDGNRTPRQSSSEECDIPMDSAKRHWPRPLPDPNVSLAVHAEPQPSKNYVHSSGGTSNCRLGGNPGDREVSQSSPAFSENQRTGMTLMRTQGSYAPLEHNAAAVNTTKSLSPDKSLASQASPSSIDSSESEAATATNLKIRPYGFAQLHQTFFSNDDVPKPRINTMQPHSKGSARKRGGQRKRLKPRPIQREPCASSMVSLEPDSLHPSKTGHLSMEECGKESAGVKEEGDWDSRTSA